MLILAGAVPALSYFAAHRRRHRDPDPDRDRVVPADDPRLSPGGRRLHRGQGQPRRPARRWWRAPPCSSTTCSRSRCSVAAGVAALTSAFPALFPYRVWLCVLAIVVHRHRQPARRPRVGPDLRLAHVPLRRQHPRHGRPTGSARRDRRTAVRRRRIEPHPPGLEGIGLFLLLRAFAAGCTALTGIEAVSDGVPAFKPPEAHNARIVMTWLGGIIVVMFLGITYLAYDLGIGPSEQRDRGVEDRPPGLRRRASSTTRSRP